VVVLNSSVAGFVTGLTLIVAIGAQNAYVLRQGLARSYVGAVVAVCAVSDLVLIFAGVSGIGAIVEHAGWVIDLVRWLGVAFLCWYAVNSFLRAMRTEHLVAESNSGVPGEARKQVIGRAVALTWLNPHVYLDTVLLIGSIAATHDDGAGARWWFAVGAGTASIAWFSGLGFGARLLAPLLARPRAWQVLDVGIAITMLFIASKLAFE
jgi:L-lysine exporter family protein LysE/ArgO